MHIDAISQQLAREKKEILIAKQLRDAQQKELQVQMAAEEKRLAAAQARQDQSEVDRYKTMIVHDSVSDFFNNSLIVFCANSFVPPGCKLKESKYIFK